MTEQEKRDMADVLKAWFPWLGTDEDVSGADQVEILCDLYERLTTEDEPVETV